MAIIKVEGLGQVEIAGETPTEEETQGIKKALDSLAGSLESEDIGATDTIIPELIDPNLAEVGEPQPKGLEIIGGRPTFEAVGAIFGSVPGASLGPAGIVAGGTLGAMGTGQLYDVLQSAITDETTDFGIQARKAKKDLSREALLQSFFAKIPGMWTGTKKLIWGKADKSLYDSAQRIGYPLSLSDAGNMISRGWGRVIGVFPFVGAPIKKGFAKKADILNKAADDTLNTFAPNVSLTKLGIDMAEASKSTFGDFRRVTSFFYDDFYKSVNKINAPVISTKNIKNSLQKFTDLVDDGTIKLTTGKILKSPQKNDIYKYAKNGKNFPEYITANQYKAILNDIKEFARKSKTEGFSIKSLTGFKSALETDLRLLTKKSYRDNLLKNVYPLSKSKKKILDPNLLSDIATKLKFADKVYANGLENSIITNAMKKQAQKEGVKLVTIPGKGAFDTPIAAKFKMIDKNIFGPGFQVQGSITSDQLGKVLLASRNVTPQLLNDLRTLVGKKQYNNFVRARLQQGFDKSLIRFNEPTRTGLMFDPYKFEANLGLDTTAGRELVESMLKGSKLQLKHLDDFFAVAKNHAGLKIPDVSSFVARRATLGGTKSVLGGFALGYTSYQNPVRGAGLIYLARKTSNFLNNPKQLEDVMRVLDPNSTASQMKVASLKLIDAMLSESQNKIEKNELSLYREYIELLPVEEIKKELDEGLPAFTEDYLNKNSKKEPLKDDKKVPELPTNLQPINDNRSQLPTPPLQTPGINPASFDKRIMAQGTVDQTGLTSSELAFLDDEEKAMRLRQRGMA